MIKTDTIQVTLLRHGRTKGNLEKRYVGRTDESIIENEAVSYYQDVLQGKLNKMNQIYVSPMKRCIETAEICYANQDYIISSKLRECDFGNFEYKNYIELEDDTLYQKWIDSNGTMPFPKGESTENFKKRCQDGFYKVVKDAVTRRIPAIGLVVHGGTIMAIMEEFASSHRDYYDWQVGNLEGYQGEVVVTYELSSKNIISIVIQNFIKV